MAADDGTDGGTGAGDYAPLVGMAGGAAGLGASLFVLFGPVVRYTSQTVAGEVTTGTVSGVDYLLGDPNAQFALLAWPLVIGAVSVVGGWAARSRRRSWVVAAAVTVSAFAVVGIASIGGLYLPAAVLLVAATALASVGRRD